MLSRRKNCRKGHFCEDGPLVTAKAVLSFPGSDSLSSAFNRRRSAIVQVPENKLQSSRMPSNQPPVSVAISRSASPETPTTSGRRSADYNNIPRVEAGFAGIRSAIGLSVLVAVACGVALAVYCTLWAIQEGVPHPLAIMIGYCTVASSAGLATALLAIQSLAARKSSTVTTRGPNYAAWKAVSKLSVSDASRLWCDIEPGCPASQESIAWGTAMLDAIKRGELPAIAKDGAGLAAGQEQSNPNWHTKIAREALMAWAQGLGHSPRFLQK